MKKFLLVLSFTLISNHLFSTPLFKELFYYAYVVNSFANDFPKKDLQENNLQCLKQIAEKYFELLKHLNYEKALKETEEHVWKNNVGAQFELDTNQINSILGFLKISMKDWIRRSEAAFHCTFVDTNDVHEDIKRIAVPNNTESITGLLEFMSPDEVVQISEHSEVIAFIEALIQFCKEELENKPKEVEPKDLYGNTIDFGKNLLKNTAHFAGGAAVGAIGLGTLGTILNAPGGSKEAIKSGYECMIIGTFYGIMGIGFIKAKPMLKQFTKELAEIL